MITLFRNNLKYPLKDLKHVVRQQIKELPQKISCIGAPQQILRFEFNCESISLLNWLHNQSTAVKIYWSNREGKEEIAGIGIADSINKEHSKDYQEIFNHIEDHLSSDNPHLRYYGGFCFNDQFLNTSWNEFEAAQFIVPQFEFFRNNKQFLFAVNLHIRNADEDSIKKILEDLEKIDFSASTAYRSVPKIVNRSDAPNRQEWGKIFSLVHKKYEKIVLARETLFNFDVKIRPSALIKHLKNHTPDCFHFCFQMDHHKAFLGASPERLFYKNGNVVESEAMAGTTPKGKEIDLISSEKIALEHKIVVDYIRQAFQFLCENFTHDLKASVLKLPNGQHLVTKFKGQLKNKIFTQDILKSLHPTPAVAGIPKDKVLKVLAEIEPFKRGWYAGAIGYIGYDECELAVAIRSGLVDNEHLSLFAGAGIVEGSNEEEEWEEIENKISRFMEIFKS